MQLSGKAKNRQLPTTVFTYQLEREPRQSQNFVCGSRYHDMLDVETPCCCISKMRPHGATEVPCNGRVLFNLSPATRVWLRTLRRGAFWNLGKSSPVNGHFSKWVRTGTANLDLGSDNGGARLTVLLCCGQWFAEPAVEQEH